MRKPIDNPKIRTIDDVYDDIIQQERKQLERKYKEELKGGYTNPDIEKLGDLNDSEAHWNSNPFSLQKNGQEQKRMKENWRSKIIYLIEWLK